MFRKILNVGKGHSSEQRLLQQQQRLQQQQNLFQLNEIRSYGFSHLNCLGFSSSLSLLAVGSKHGLLRILGKPSVEFSYQLGSNNSIRQIEFIDCRRDQSNTNNKPNGNSKQDQPNNETDDSTPAKLVVLTDNGQLHLFRLNTVRQQNFADNTTQTDAVADCCQPAANNATSQDSTTIPISNNNLTTTPEYTKLEQVGVLDYFRHKPDDEDRSKRVTTLETSADGKTVFVGTEGGNVYLVPLDKFEPVDQQQVQQSEITSASTQLVTGVRPIRGDSHLDPPVTGVKILDDGVDVDQNSRQHELTNNVDDDETTAVNLNDEPTRCEDVVEPFTIIEFERNISNQIDDETIKLKKQGAVESIKRHPSNGDKLLLSYHRGLSVIFNVSDKSVDKYFYHNQVLESSCFSPTTSQATGGAGLEYNFIYTSHNDGSYVKWDLRQGNQSQANEDMLGQLYGPYPCKPTPKIQACTGLANDQLEELIIFSGGMPRATYDDKNPVTIVRADPSGKDTIKTVLDFTSKVLDFVVITRPRGDLSGSNSTGGGSHSGGGKSGGKKNKNKQQQQQQQLRNQPIAVALAILAEEEFVVIDLLDSGSYLEFPLPYLNCVHSSAITCNQHYSDISDDLYEQLLAHSRQQLRGKSSSNEWPITGGKVIEAPEMKSHDILLTGHEDGSVDIWDVSDLSMHHLIHLSTARFFSTNDDDLVPINDEHANTNESTQQTTPTENHQQSTDSTGWPPLKRVGRFDPYSDDTRLAVRRLSLCPRTGTLVVAGTGGQVLVFELNEQPSELSSLKADSVTIVSDQRFTWKGREKLEFKSSVHKQEPGYQLGAYVQLDPPVSATSIDLRSDWHLFAVGTSYGFLLYDYANKHSVVQRCTLNVQDFAIVSGDAAGVAGAISRKKSFRKSLRESFRRLRRGRSQRNSATPAPVTGVVASPSPAPSSSQDQQQQQAPAPRPAFSRSTTGIRSLNPPAAARATSPDQQSTAALAAAAHRNLYSAERQVEQKVELSSIVRCITLTAAVIGNNAGFKPSLWVGTNSGQVLVYAIDLASEADGAGAGDSAPTSARLAKEIQLKHKAPIVAIFTTPEQPPEAAAAPAASSSASDDKQSAKSTPEKRMSELTEAAGGDNCEAAKQSNDSARPADESAARLATPDTLQQQQQGKSPGKKGSPQGAAAGAGDLPVVQPRVLICSEEQFKVFNLPNLKPFCKFKLTAHEGLRAKKISITQFLKPPAQPAAGAQNNRQQQQQQTKASSVTKLNSSKSLQSFATQTSPPASPVPPADNQQPADSSSPNGRGESATAAASNNDESNNNSPAMPNSNHTGPAGKQQTGSKDLLNAKFGASNKSSTMSDITMSAADNAPNSNKSGAGAEQSADESSFEPYMVCMSNQGDCAIYSVPELKRQAQIQVCKREDINGITSTMLTNYGEGYYLKSSSNFLRFSISSQRVLRVLSVV